MYSLESECIGLYRDPDHVVAFSYEPDVVRYVLSEVLFAEGDSRSL